MKLEYIEYIEYIVYTRQVKSNPTILTKLFQSGKEIKFFVNSKYSQKRFPKKGFDFYAMAMADFISVDGRLYKNRFGKIGE